MKALDIFKIVDEFFKLDGNSSFVVVGSEITHENVMGYLLTLIFRWIPTYVPDKPYTCLETRPDVVYSLTVNVYDEEGDILNKLKIARKRATTQFKKGTITHTNMDVLP